MFSSLFFMILECCFDLLIGGTLGIVVAAVVYWDRLFEVLQPSLPISATERTDSTNGAPKVTVGIPIVASHFGPTSTTAKAGEVRSATVSAKAPSQRATYSPASGGIPSVASSPSPLPETFVLNLEGLAQYSSTVEDGMKDFLEGHEEKKNEWEPNGLKDGVARSLRRLKNVSVPRIKGHIVVDCCPASVLAALINPDINVQRQIDKKMKRVEVLETLSPFADIIYIEFEPVWPTSGRDFVMLRWIQVDENGVLYCFFRSTTHPRAAAVKAAKTVRATTGLTAYVLEPLDANGKVLLPSAASAPSAAKHFGGGDADPKAAAVYTAMTTAPKCSLTYYAMLDPGGSLPNVVLQKLANEQPLVIRHAADTAVRLRARPGPSFPHEFMAAIPRPAPLKIGYQDGIAFAALLAERAEAPASPTAPSVGPASPGPSPTAVSNEDDAVNLPSTTAGRADLGVTAKHAIDCAIVFDNASCWKQTAEDRSVKLYSASYADLLSVFKQHLSTSHGSPSSSGEQAVSRTAPPTIVARHDVLDNSISPADPSSVLCFKGVGECSIAPRYAFDALRHPSSRFHYDSMLRSCTILDTLDPFTHVIHLVFQARAGCISSARDFVILLHSAMREDTYLIIGRSVEHPDCPPVPGVVRAVAYPSGWIIRPMPSISEPRSSLTYFVASNFRGKIPAKLASFVMHKQPLCIDKFRRIVNSHKLSNTMDMLTSSLHANTVDNASFDETPSGSFAVS